MTDRKDYSSDLLQDFISPQGRPDLSRVRTLNGLLLEMGHQVDVRTIVDCGETAHLRSEILPYAIMKGVDFRK